jgi:hypothetical protein
MSPEPFWGSAGTTAVDRFQYGYDYAGNRTWRENVVAAANSKDYDYFYDYDGLDRLKNSQQGNLAGTWPNYTGISGTPGREERWALDQLGNWEDFEVDTTGTTVLDQQRTHNAVNEILTISTSMGR